MLKPFWTNRIYIFEEWKPQSFVTLWWICYQREMEFFPKGMRLTLFLRLQRIRVCVLILRSLVKFGRQTSLVKCLQNIFDLWTLRCWSINLKKKKKDIVNRPSAEWKSIRCVCGTIFLDEFLINHFIINSFFVSWLKFLSEKLFQVKNI